MKGKTDAKQRFLGGAQTKVYQTSIGFFDLAIAPASHENRAGNMGFESNLFIRAPPEHCAIQRLLQPSSVKRARETALAKRCNS